MEEKDIKTSNISSISAKEKRHYGLSRAECNALRGIAIIGIFLHNYCHWLNMMVKENEYQYFRSNVSWLSQVITYADKYLPLQLVSFFGHYGVPVFLFLSAYGLVLKYESSSSFVESNAKFSAKVNNIYVFLRYHFLKLFKMMIVGYVAFTIVDNITPGEHHYKVMDIIAQLGLFNNLLPNPDNIIWPGPFWFFGLMLQLYIVYRVFLYRKHWKWTVGAMVLCLLVQCLFEPEGETMNRYRYNFMGGMLPFGMGILYARYFKQSLSLVNETAVFILSTFLVFFFSYNQYSWALVPFFICTAGISFVKIMPAIVSRQLEWFGGISAALFICHPVTRKIFIPISRHGDIYEGLLLYIIASVCLAWLFKNLLKKIPSPSLKPSVSKENKG